MRDCGATTDCTSIVNVESSSEKFRAGEGRVFVATGEHNLSLEWTGPRTPLVKCSACMRKDIFLENVALGDIDVTYYLGKP